MKMSVSSRARDKKLVVKNNQEVSAYDALVSMAQPWNKRYPLITFQGNMGSRYGEPPAAMRYTEAKLSKIGESMMEGIEKNAVPMESNYDNTTTQPKYLPGLFPGAILNGTAGIATGMASKMPPHYAADVFNAIKYVLNCAIKRENPNIKKVISYIKAPDFPTGGVIINPEDLPGIYMTGRGSVKIRARYHIEDHRNGKQSIVFDEVPYDVNQKSLIEDLGNKVYNDNADRILHDNIADISDHTEKGKIRIIIDLKKNANPDLVLNKIFKMTQFQTSFAVNSTLLVDGRPREHVDILKIIELYCRHQLRVKVNVTKFELDKCNKRLEIVNGFIKANPILEDIVKTIRSANNHEEVISSLMSQYGFTEPQAKALDAKRLGSLNKMDTSALMDEKELLDANIARYNNILNNKEVLVGELIKDIDEYSKKDFFKNDKRRTEIADNIGEIKDRDLIEEENIVVFYTHNGMVKAVKSSDYNEQGRAGKGSSVKLRDNDFIEKIIHLSNKEDIVVITNLGRAYSIPAYTIPIVSKNSVGKYLNNFVSFKKNESIIKILSVKHGEKIQLLFVTKKGLAKRLDFESASIRRNGVIVTKIDDGDSLAAVLPCNGYTTCTAVTHHGLAFKTSLENIPVIGRNTRGSKLLRFKFDDDYVVSAITTNDDDTFIVVTEAGFCMRCPVSAIPYRENRGGKGVYIYKPNDKSGKVLSAFEAKEDETIFIVTSENMIIRIPVNSIRETNRGTVGVRTVKMGKGSTIVTVVPAPSEQEEQEENGDD